MTGPIVFFVGIFLLGITNGKEPSTTRALVPACSEPCSACKDITEGSYKGSWNLVEKISPRCPGSCLYQKNETLEEMCFCDPGPINYESCVTIDEFMVGNTTRCNTRNPWQSMSLTCGTIINPKTISVVNVVYGVIGGAAKCQDPNAKKMVTALCTGQSSCTLTGRTSIGAAPCWRDGPVLQVCYECV